MSDLPACPPDHPRFRIDSIKWGPSFLSHGRKDMYRSPMPRWRYITELRGTQRDDCANAAIVAWWEESRRCNRLARMSRDDKIRAALYERGTLANQHAADWWAWKDHQPEQEGTG